jgi:putative ABC transport system permease protein
MVNIESIKYSLRNLNHRKGRSLLTILSIFMGIATIFIFISFGFGLYNYINDLSSGTSVSKVLIQAKGVGAPGLDDTFALTESDLEVIRKTPGIAEATAISFKTAEILHDGKKVFVFIVGYNPEDGHLLFELSDVGIDKGRWLDKKEKGKVLAGYNYQVKDIIFEKPFELNDKINVQNQDLRIVGFLEAIGSPPDDAQLYVTQDQLDILFPDNNYGWIIANVKDVQEIDLVIERLEDRLRKNRDLEKGKEDFFVQSYEDLIESFSGALNIVIGFIILIALISVLVSAVNTSNTMITSVLERIKEIGIMKAVGSPNSAVFNIFLFESSFLGFIAGAIGVIVGYIITSITGSILDNLGWGFLAPYYHPYLFIGLIAFATITGAISGVLPAINASKIKPVDALRYE